MAACVDGTGPRPLASRKVCVIGAGMAGLAAARELRREGHAVAVLEQGADVGGQWLYDPRTDESDDDAAAADDAPVRVHSSMYASLRLLGPREVMGFSDFQFVPRKSGGRDARRFPGHREVYLYLRDFCRAAGLVDAVRFNARVVRVAMAPPRRGGTGDADALQWVVRSMDAGIWRQRADDDRVAEAQCVEEVFDAVVVATGHYSQPRLPSIEGVEDWRRRQLHSHSYRVPDPFRDEVVVVVGCGDSGMDIALELRAVAREVHLSAKSVEAAMTPAMSKMLARHANLRLRPQIERLCADGRVVFADGTCVVADTVMYCTGYRYSFPFLDTDGRVTVDDNRVGPLFEHTFPPSLAPSLSFVGIPRKVMVPWFFEAQGRWIAGVLSGRRALPTEEEMTRSVEDYYRARELAGVLKKYTHDVEPHKMYELGEKYCDFPRTEDWKRELMAIISRNTSDDMETFRDRDDDSDNVRKCMQEWHLSPLKASAEHGSDGLADQKDGLAIDGKDADWNLHPASPGPNDVLSVNNMQMKRRKRSKTIRVFESEFEAKGIPELGNTLPKSTNNMFISEQSSDTPPGNTSSVLQCTAENVMHVTDAANTGQLKYENSSPLVSQPTESEIVDEGNSQVDRQECRTPNNNGVDLEEMNVDKNCILASDGADSSIVSTLDKEENAKEAPSGVAVQAERARCIKYTFNRRKRKTASLDSTLQVAVPEKSSSLVCPAENHESHAKPETQDLLIESTPGDNQLIHVAQQLIMLSAQK
ncbi:flavin-containing monooxygenase FMO GS-OX-like 8 [Oryza brachyantha]|uniref:flavin-containing monooxygenase FMO GS-OX-like 8 n=1 Tax=Oryza brachyantha TaxID=4533 RepID=UPI001ADD16D5|nr:flavin-containing monooxygenase FMO GS-OX-like 8 [Oryza brachyantha]